MSPSCISSDTEELQGTTEPGSILVSGSAGWKPLGQRRGAAENEWGPAQSGSPLLLPGKVAREGRNGRCIGPGIRCPRETRFHAVVGWFCTRNRENNRKNVDNFACHVEKRVRNLLTITPSFASGKKRAGEVKRKLLSCGCDVENVFVIVKIIRPGRTINASKYDCPGALCGN